MGVSPKSIFTVVSVMNLCAKFHTFVPISAMVELTALTKMKDCQSTQRWVGSEDWRRRENQGDKDDDACILAQTIEGSQYRDS